MAFSANDSIEDLGRTDGPRTIYEKIWNQHVVTVQEDGTALVYIDRHLVHEVTSPQAFDALRDAGRTLRRPELTLAVPDHNVVTTARVDSNGRRLPTTDEPSAQQLDALRQNASEFGIEYIDEVDPSQGIVHVVGPEQGFTLPGLTIVCGDSHTATHGALGAVGFGIGTTEIEHVLATQTLWLKPSKTLEVRIEGRLGTGVTSKDLALNICSKLTSAGGVGYVAEYTGDAIRELSVEARFTVCNMAIEAGARAGLVAPDEKTFDYLKGRPRAPQGPEWDRAVEYWRSLGTDPGATYDKRVTIQAADIAPSVTWGTSPDAVAPITGVVPNPSEVGDPLKRAAMEQALAYMGLSPGERLENLSIDVVFIGSCTNSRIEDLRAAAKILRGRRIAPSIRQALVVPGSGLVKRQAEKEGLDRIFTEAGFEWREPGCSMCLGMNPDRVLPGERCASTSNRNFVGRQGPGARTHLLSPPMAAAAAIMGKLSDVRKIA